MRVIFMGTPEFAVAALDKIAHAHDVVCVYTQPPRPAGRGQTDRPSPVQVWAEAHNIPVRYPKSLKSAEAQAEFAALNADVAVVAAYGLILPQAILDAPKFGCLNIHASLLPRWRGAAPIQRAIMAGDKDSGVTIMQMDVGLDTGDMLLIKRVPIAEDTTAQDLHDALAAVGGDLIIEALSQIDTLPRQPQPADGVTYATKIDKAEAKIDFSRSAPDVVRHIHGLSPFPGAWLEVKGERIKILKAQVMAGQGRAGDVLDDAFLIACGEGAMKPVLVQRAGRGVVPLADFLRGFTLPRGTRLA
jgi:methionyl-tRNA formyltransferase